MSKEGKYPQRIGRPPIGLIAIQNNGIVFVDALFPHQAGKFLAVDKVARQRAQQLGAEINPRGRGNVPDIVQKGVFIDLDDAQPFNAQARRQPRSGDKPLWVRILLEWGIGVYFCHCPPAFLIKRDDSLPPL